jgi:hypothetical protein
MKVAKQKLKNKNNRRKRRSQIETLGYGDVEKKTLYLKE